MLNKIIKVTKREIWKYDKELDIYKLAHNIKETDIINWEYVEREGTEISELIVTLKPLPIYSQYVPKSKFEVNSIQPLIIKVVDYINGNPKTVYESLILGFEYNRNEEENVVVFKGSDFKEIENRKLITTNKDFSKIIEPDDDDQETEAVELPNDFAMYVKNAKISTALNELYVSAITQPKQILYGAIGDIDETRRVKGMGSVEVNTNDNNSYNIRLEQIPLLEAKQKLFDKMGRELQTRFNTENGKINVVVEESKIVEKNVIQKNQQIKEQDYGYEQEVNFIASHGNANKTYQESRVYEIDFTSYEKQEDFSFIAGNNEEYLISPTKSELEKSIKEAREFIKLEIDFIFRILHAGYIFYFNERYYKVLQIQETFSSEETWIYDLEIEQVENIEEYR